MFWISLALFPSVVRSQTQSELLKLQEEGIKYGEIVFNGSLHYLFNK